MAADSIPCRRAARWIGDAAAGPLERGDARHFVRGEGEIEDVEVFGHALRVRGSRNRHDVALLDEPTQRDLRDRASALLRDLRENRIVEEPAAAKRARNCSTAAASTEPWISW